MTNVLALVGSLRAASTNRKLAEAAVDNAPDGVSVDLFDRIGDLPFYNEELDVEGRVPAAALALRAEAAEADALVLFTPEYNGTLPAVLKNAIDWLSRPYDQAPIKDKPAAVVGTALGQYGGLWAQEEARKALGIAGAAVLGEVKLAIPGSLARFGELHPRDDEEIVGQLVTVFEGLREASSATVGV